MSAEPMETGMTMLRTLARFAGALAFVMAGGSAMAAEMKADALLSIDRNRATVIERITGDWGAPLEDANAGIDREQLRSMLQSLRADHLLAASLAGSLDGLRNVLDAAAKSEVPQRAVKRIAALGDANRDLVYTPVTPCRLFDTRASQGGLGTPTVNVARTYGATAPVASQGGPGGCAAREGAAVALIQIGTLSPAGSGLLQGGPQGAVSFPNALILYQAGDQYGTAVAMPLNLANGQFDLVEQFAPTDVYGDLLGYFSAPTGPPLTPGGNSLGGTLSLGTNDGNAVEIEANATRVMRYETVGTSPSVVGGHPANAAGSPPEGQTIAGGGAAGSNCLDPVSDTLTAACANLAASLYTTVGGGIGNVASGSYSIVGGGESNYTYGNAANIGGGRANYGNGDFSAIGGGAFNMTDGAYATTPGGYWNVASGIDSLAAGNLAMTQDATATIIHRGVFVFADSSNAPFYTEVSDEFAARATGGVRFVSAINGAGVPTAGVSLAAGAGSWASLSDRNAKRDIVAVDTAWILDRIAAMPIHSWRYRTERSGARHLGPTAQDFHAAFGLGDSDRTITTIDENGVALAAIQGLNAKLDAQLLASDSTIDADAARLAELQSDRAHRAARLMRAAGELADLRREVEALLATAPPDGSLANTR